MIKKLKKFLVLALIGVFLIRFDVVSADTEPVDGASESNEGKKNITGFDVVAGVISGVTGIKVTGEQLKEGATQSQNTEVTVNDDDLNKAVTDAKKYVDSGKAEAIKKHKKKIITIWKYGKKKGWSDAALAGMIGNAVVESGLNASSVDNGAYGAWQMTGGRAENMKKTCEGSAGKWQSLGAQGEWVIDTASAQFAMYDYTVQSGGDGKLLKDNFDAQRQKAIDWKSSHSKGKFTAEKDTKPLAEYGIDLDKYGYDSYTAISDPRGAGFMFLMTFERAQGALFAVANEKYKDDKGAAGFFVKEFSLRPAVSEIVNNAYGNGVASSSTEVDKETAEDIAKSAVANGMMNESEFIEWKSMTDIVIEWADIEDLSDEENETLSLWKGDLEKDNSDTFLIKSGRYVTLTIGILINIWMVFIYLAYWVDRINNFIDVDFLPMVTLGKLMISPTEEECTFTIRDLAKSEKRTINHRHIISVCLIGICFGMLIISGLLFRVLNILVNKVLSLM